MKRKRKPKNEDGVIAVPIERYFPDGIETHYSDDLVIQHSEQAFFFSFFEVERPITLAEDEAARLRKVRAKCVSRIVVTPEQMWSIVIAAIKNFRRFADKYGVSIEELKKAEEEEVIDIESIFAKEDISEVDQAKAEDK